MINYQVDYDDKQVRRLFRKLSEDMPEINRRILGLLSQEVTTRSQGQYLTGGHPLRRITGKLAQSVGAGAHVFDDYAVVGTNISYGAYHEFGFHGRVQVRQHTRHTAENDMLIRAHGRNVDYAGKPFMRPALNDIFGTRRAVTVIEIALKDEIAKRASA